MTTREQGDKAMAADRNPYERIGHIFQALYASEAARKDRTLCQDITRELGMLKWQIDSLETEAATARREAAEAANEVECYEVKLDDITSTLDMVHTGFRDYADLERTIYATA